MHSYVSAYFAADDDACDDDDADDDDDEDDDDDDDDGKEAKTTPGSDLYWPALPGASGGIKAVLYSSNITLQTSTSEHFSSAFFHSHDIETAFYRNIAIHSWIYKAAVIRAKHFL